MSSDSFKILESSHLQALMDVNSVNLLKENFKINLLRAVKDVNAKCHCDYN